MFLDRRSSDGKQTPQLKFAEQPSPTQDKFVEFGLVLRIFERVDAERDLVHFEMSLGLRDKTCVLGLIRG